MQAERKELQGNALAQQLNRAYEGIKQGPSRGTIIVLALVITAVLLFILFRYFWVSSSSADSQRWLMVDSANFPEQLNALLDDKELKDTPQHRIVRFKEARMKMSQGLRDWGNGNSNIRERAKKNVEEAVDLYDKLAKESSRTPQLHQEALWAAAKGYETLGGSDNLARATERYETLKKEYEKSALGKDAEKQLKRLSNPSTKQTLSDLGREFDGK
jgi:hypothetical protein